MSSKLKNIRKKCMHVFGGTILTEDIVMKNTRFIAVIFIIAVLYISNRYSCSEKVARIEQLQSELKDAKYESLTISAQLEGISRESRVREMLNKKNLDIERTKDPIYKIEK